MVDVWRGSILTHDGSLQLLLLVDYIFDWARDNYREDIIRLLKRLASSGNETASIYADTAIYSTRAESAFPNADQELERQEYLDRVSLRQQFAALGTQVCAIRHAAVIETRYRCLYLTEDTYEDFWRYTIKTKAKEAKLRAGLRRQFTNPVLVHGKTLDMLEQKWTGSCRVSRAKESLFYINLTFSTFLSANWDVVREIHVIACTESLKGELVSPSVISSTDNSDEVVLEIVRRLKQDSMASQLQAAISRQCFVFRVPPGWKNDSNLRARRWHCCGEYKYGITHTCAVPRQKHYPRDMVEYIYRLCKRGSIEPGEAFLRVSERLDQLGTTGLDSERLNNYGTKELNASQDGYVLVWSSKKFQAEEKSPTNICIYIIAESMTGPSKSELLHNARRALRQSTSTTRLVRATTQVSQRPSQSVAGAIGT